MAEVVGIVASGISIGTLVAQIGSSIVTLKNHWDAVKEAPRNLIDLLEEIEDLRIILADIEDDQARNSFPSFLLDSTSTTKCLTHCKRAAMRLKEVVNDLKADTNSSSLIKRKKSAFMSVLESKKAERYTNKLTSAVRLLSLSHQCYIRSLLHLQPDILLARLSQTPLVSQVIMPKDSSHDSNFADSSINAYSEASQESASRRSCSAKPFSPTFISYLLGWCSYERRKSVVSMEEKSKNGGDKADVERHEIRVYFRAPAWLLNRAWELEGRRACFGWNFNLSTHNFIASKSDIFKYAQTRGVNDIKDLFKNHSASPFDTDEFGQTVLHHAARRGRLKICKFLLDHGAKIHVSDNEGRTPLDLLASEGLIVSVPEGGYESSGSTFFGNVQVELFYPLGSRRCYLQGAIDTARLLIYDLEVTEKCLSQFVGPVQAFSILKSYCHPPYYTNSLHERASIALSLANQHQTTARLFQTALSETELDAEVFNYRNATGDSIIHAVARALGLCASQANGKFYQRNQLARNPTNGGEWAVFLRKCVSSGCDIHGIRADSLPIISRRTPLLEVMHGFFHLSVTAHAGTNPYFIEKLLRFYLFVLQVAGIDLVDYGRKEKQLHDQRAVDKTFQYTFWPTDSRQMAIEWIGISSAEATWDLIGFTYGPSPDDWQFWGSQPTDIFAGDFWKMMESPWERMPGAWVE